MFLLVLHGSKTLLKCNTNKIPRQRVKNSQENEVSSLYFHTQHHLHSAPAAKNILMFPEF